MSHPDDDIMCPLFFKLQEFFRRRFSQSEEEAETNARAFMRETWLGRTEPILTATELANAALAHVGHEPLTSTL